MLNNKILFINPAQSCDINTKFNNIKFPLGFLYMAGHLEKNGFKARILDCPVYYKKRRIINKKTVKIGLFPEEISEIIKEFDPVIIGVSCAYSAYESDSFEIIDLIRELEKDMNKKFLIVVGGAHVSANPEYVLRNKKIDIAVIGEGEETILEIAQKFSKGLKFNNIQGTALLQRGKLVINKKREYIKNLDSLKSAWHLIDLDLYFQHPDNSKATLRKPSVDIISSRGCPGNCRFCSIHTVWGRKWRGRTAKNVVDEIEFLYKKYGVVQFRFQDDNLTLDKNRIIEICEEIIRRNLDIKWDTPNGIAIWTLDGEILRKMKKAGCYRITFGIESGCKKTQEYIRKIIDIEKINHLIDVCHEMGMWVCSTFIIGFPYETKKDIEKTKRFILNSKINFPFVYIAQPYLGTDMYEDFRKENLLSDIKETSNIQKTKYSTLYFTNTQLNLIRSDIYRQFYLRKILSYLNLYTFYKEFLSKIKNFEDFKYSFKNFYHIFLGG